MENISKTPERTDREMEGYEALGVDGGSFIIIMQYENERRVTRLCSFTLALVYLPLVCRLSVLESAVDQSSPKCPSVLLTKRCKRNRLETA